MPPPTCGVPSPVEVDSAGGASAPASTSGLYFTEVVLTEGEATGGAASTGGGVVIGGGVAIASTPGGNRLFNPVSSNPAWLAAISFCTPDRVGNIGARSLAAAVGSEKPRAVPKRDSAISVPMFFNPAKGFASSKSYSAAGIFFVPEPN